MKRILVADDDELILDVVNATLSSLGYDVSTVSGGREALQRVESENFDLVILDVMMPDLGGIETIIELRRNQPEQPIIVMSGQFPTSAGTLENVTEKLGARVLLAKPFTAQQLSDAVREQIGA
jgi:CheY-like chemotaxis protein